MITDPSPLLLSPLLLLPLLITWIGTKAATPKRIRQQMRRRRTTAVRAVHAPLVAAAVASVITPERPMIQLRCLMCGNEFDIPAEYSFLERGVVGWQVVGACTGCRGPAASRSLTRELAEQALQMNVAGEL